MSSERQPAQTAGEDRREREDRLFRKTEAWLYAVPEWLAYLQVERGHGASGLPELPVNAGGFHVSRPTERLSVTRADLERRLHEIAAVYRTLRPKERQFVQMRYWLETKARVGVSLAAIARSLGMHRNSISKMRRRVVRAFRRGLFGSA